MKFLSLRLGTSVYFDRGQQDNITSEKYDIESCDSPSGFILTSKKDGLKHFISIYNVAYGKVDDNQLKLENDALMEANGTDGSSEISQAPEGASSTIETKATRGRRPKKD